MSNSDSDPDSHSVDIFSLWAKTDRKDPVRWHALPYHLIEVGAVARVLWDEVVPRSRKQHWAERLGLGGDLAGRFLAFIAACHDAGKASTSFQRLSKEQRERLRPIGEGVFALSDAAVPNAPPHGMVTASTLPGILRDQFGFDPKVAKRYALLTGCHHGILTDQDSLNIIRKMEGDLIGTGIWNRLRSDLATWLYGAFELPLPLPDSVRSTLLSYHDALWLAGLISVADWLGSDSDTFTFRTDRRDTRTMRAEAERLAHQSIERNGWIHDRPHVPSATFQAAWPNLPDPFREQVLAVEAVKDMRSPGIAVIEYPMGKGKTEIALWAAAHWAERFDIPGFYVAMPTMATSDQLHERVKAHLDRHRDPDTSFIHLQLLHGQAALSVEPEDVDEPLANDLADQLNPEFGTRHDRRQNVIQRATWFTRRKRGLLATYGVGTVDQALLGVLQSKHFFVRLHGLAGKTIIFDEVHSFDVYMNSLFDELLAWLGALGSPVVVLTATLPAARTQEMLDAYVKGAGWNPEASSIEPYPRVTTMDRERIRSRHAEPKPEDTRTVHLRWIQSTGNDDTASIWHTVGSELDDRLSDSGTAAIICNTVKQAQEAWQTLKHWFPPSDNPVESQLSLFHARFRQTERGTIQEQVLTEFGKRTHEENGQRIRPRRKVVIATQVLEQSLDLDFDLMVSMFCPTDLLLQRSGRLQRHPTTDDSRPPGFASHPELWIVGFSTLDGDLPSFPRGSSVIYGDYLLLRSWFALKGRDTLTIPQGIEALIEATYGDASEHLTEVLAESRCRFDRKIQEQKDKAKGSKITPLDRDRPANFKDALIREQPVRDEEDDEPELHPDALARTRLGPPSVRVVLLKRREAERFGHLIAKGRKDRFTGDEQRELLRRSVSLQDVAIVRSLRNHGPPNAAWEESPFLRHHRLLLLDDRNQRQLWPGFSIELDRELGVIYGDQATIHEETDA